VLLLSFVYTHCPLFGLQESSVHGLLSSHVVVAPGWQEPPLQTSPVVQALPSLHDALLGAKTQAPLLVLQLSSVHELLSLHTVAEPDWHWPPVQTSPLVQALPSLHGVLFGFGASAGHGLFTPSQVSAASHGPAAARHTPPAGAGWSAGQPGPEPLHDSGASQTSVAGRQTPPFANPSAGQSRLVPSHVSATSQTPFP
jgi:hypothetical protein